MAKRGRPKTYTPFDLWVMKRLIEDGVSMRDAAKKLRYPTTGPPSKDHKRRANTLRNGYMRDGPPARDPRLDEIEQNLQGARPARRAKRAKARAKLEALIEEGEALGIPAEVLREELDTPPIDPDSPVSPGLQAALREPSALVRYQEKLGNEKREAQEVMGNAMTNPNRLLDSEGILNEDEAAEAAAGMKAAEDALATIERCEKENDLLNRLVEAETALKRRG